MDDYQALVDVITNCQQCPLCQTRTQTVPGEGNLQARLMIIGEGPGADEDRYGRPFIGRAGQLLDQMLDAIDLKREDIYITNIVKCRPPQNRTPKDEEAQACLGYLHRQIALVNPQILLLMGATALNQYYDKNLRITKARGTWFEKDGRMIMATFHPAALLRDASKKTDAFMDMLAVKRMLAGE